MMPASLVTSLRLTPPAADNWLLADPGTLQTTLAATHQTTHKTQLGCAEFTFFVKINLSPERGDESASNTNTVRRDGDCQVHTDGANTNQNDKMIFCKHL